jgi:hypothetical protein
VLIDEVLVGSLEDLSTVIECIPIVLSLVEAEVGVLIYNLRLYTLHLSFYGGDMGLYSLCG